MRDDDLPLLLRVYLRNTDKCSLMSAADTLVERAYRSGVAGATAMQAILGVDWSGELMEARPWSILRPASMVVEFVDQPQVINSFLPVILDVTPRALITVQEVYARFYQLNRKTPATATDQDVQAGSLDMPLWHHPDKISPLKLGQGAQLLRVFMRGTDMLDGEPLHRAAVLRARDLGLAWAGVFRGTLGYGAARCLRAAGLFAPVAELPLVIEILDRNENARQQLPFFEAALDEGVVTVEDVILVSG